MKDAGHGFHLKIVGRIANIKSGKRNSFHRAALKETQGKFESPLP